MTSVELAVDSGDIVAGQRSMPVRELELELKSGATDDLFRLAGEWSARHGLWLCTASKAERGERLGEGTPVKAVAPSVKAKAGGAAFLVATLEACLSQVVGNASELGADAADPQFVHELRVGLRRMRTALRELDRFATGIDPAWEPVLGRTFKALGLVRDRESVVPGVLAEMRAADVDCAWPAAAAGPCPDPGEVVREPSFQRTLLSILAFCHLPPVPRKDRADGRRSLRKKLARRLEKIHEGLSQDAKQFPTLSPSDRHRVRKRLKRLRYLSEFARPLFDGKAVDRYLKGWRELQDALGRYNDYRICLDAVGEVTVDGRVKSTALAWLEVQLNAYAVRSARALRKAAKRREFWTS